MVCGAVTFAPRYNQAMARKTKPQAEVAGGPDWYLKEWMAALEVSQAKLASDCGWSRGTMHGIYHGRTAYYRDLVNLMAEKLNIRAYELLLHPDDAMALRRMRQDALRVVENTKDFSQS